MSGFYGSGEVWVERIVNGVGTGMRKFGNTTEFKIEEGGDQEDRISNGLTDNGNALDTVINKVPTKFSVKTDDFSAENLAIVFLGLTSEIAESGDTFTAEDYTVPATGYIKLNNKNITAGVVVVDSLAAPVTFDVESLKVGILNITDPGVVAGDVVTITYSTAARTVRKTVGATDSSIVLRVELDGLNRATQKPVSVTIPKVVVIPTDGVDFMQRAFADINLEGVVNKLPLEDAYTVIEEV